MSTVRKRLIAPIVVIAVALCLAFSAVAAFATQTGTITVSKAKVDQTYTIYRIMDLESYDAAKEAYAYKANEAWASFLAQDDVKGVYVNIDDQGYITWVVDADQQAFAQKACAYAGSKGIANQGTQKATSTTVTFSNLTLGYYLMDSSMGALCALDTTNPDVTVEEKNFVPTVEKKVNRGGEAYGDDNTAKIGDTVLFRTVVAADAGAQNYILHDTLSAGLTFKGIPETVGTGESALPGIYYRHSGADSTAHELTAGTDYNLVTASLGDTCTFHIVFTQSFLQSITDKVYINIHYTAQLNENAVVGDTGNENDTWLTYGDDQKTAVDSTTTYTYKFDVVKIDGGKNILAGATFKMYDAETQGTEIQLVALDGNVYRVATPEEKAAEDFTPATISAGMACIQGLANGTYYLEEITAPDGYNKLGARKAVTIADADNEATLNAAQTAYVTGGVSVVNRTGTILPSTGGVGTVVFFVIGGALVVVAVAAIGRKLRRGSQDANTRP